MSIINSDSVRAGASGAVTAAYTIEQSCRFNDDDSAFLTRTPGVAGNTRTWTFSVWFKRGNITSVQNLFNAGASEDIAINAADQLIMNMGTCNYISTQLFRDPGAWFHLVVAVDTTQATAASRVRFYGNGTEITAFGTETNPAQNEELAVNSSTLHSIGSNEGGTEEWDGYMADVHFIDGQQLSPTSFGETDSNGQWSPIEFEEGSVGSAATVTHTATGTIQGTNANVFTFSGLDIYGSVNARRVVVIAGGQGGSAGSAAISGITVDGNACSLLVAATPENDNNCEMWYVDLDESTATGDVVVTWASGDKGNTGCDVFVIEGYGVEFKSLTSNATVGTGDLDIKAGGVAISGWYNGAGTASARTTAWTGLTERSDQNNTGENVVMSSASDAFASAQSGLTITSTLSGSSAGQAMVMTSFCPVDETYGTNGYRLDIPGCC